MARSPYDDVPAAPIDLDLAEVAAGRELEIDIGFGRGHFLLERAKERPDALLLGLEVRKKWVAVAIERARRAGIENVRPMLGDARDVLRGMRPDAALSWAFVHFPDPWWKKRHGKRRLLQAPTVREIARLLRPGGRLLVQTDVLERAEAYRAVLEAEPLLVDATGGSPLVASPVAVASHRERQCLESGLPVYRLLYRRG